MKKIRLNTMICIILIIAIAMVLIWNKNNNEIKNKVPYDDGVVQLDLDSIYLKKSGVQVYF